MKKVLLTILAAAALASCHTEDTLNVPSPKAIAFDNAFVFTTRAADPSITTDGADGTKAIDAFKVWMCMDSARAALLVDELVSKTAEGKWAYEHIQFWMPNHTYYFGAVAPVQDAHWTLDTANADTLGAGTLSFTNAEGTEDLLYAATSVSTEGTMVGQDLPPVKFFFSHLLSKVKCTFSNGFPEGNVTLKVSNVTMSAPKSGTINLAVENWWDNKDDWQLGEDSVMLSFGDVETELQSGIPAECAFKRLTIPAGKDHSYTITFDVDVYVSGIHAYKVTRSSTLTGYSFQMGKAYNLVAAITPANLDLQEIKFEVQVKNWVEEEIND